jgi:hypothetical protein
MPSRQARNPRLIENIGSAARDFCMVERNILSHFKLALLLSLLASSVLLKVRLIPGSGTDYSQSLAGVPMATMQSLASLAVIAAGWWEYRNHSRDITNMRAFLVTK